MKRSNLFKIITASVLTLSTAIVPLTLPASAQIVEPGIEREGIYEEDDGFDWGWLGLIGLLGLAGLAGKQRQEVTAYREPESRIR